MAEAAVAAASAEARGGRDLFVEPDVEGREISAACVRE